MKAGRVGVWFAGPPDRTMSTAGTRLAFGMLTIGGCAVLGFGVWAAAPQDADAARQFLAAHLRVGPGDMRRILEGTVVAHALEAEDRREVAARGVVRIRVPADLYLTRLSDIVSFKRHEAVQQIGVFSESPSPADLQGLTLDRGDLRDLRGCRPGHCDMNLPAEAMARFQREVAWGSAEAEAEATALMRQVLAEYVAEYRRRGGAAPMLYADEQPPVDAAAEFRALIASDGGLLGQLPGLPRYALDYPHGSGAGVRDLVYWSREKPGPSPTITITHLIMWPVYRHTPGSPVRHAVLSRQIYGSRYFDASMGLTLLLPDPAAPGGTTYVVYLNRSRLDVFGGLFGGLIKRTVRGRVRSGMAESLARVKAAMERDSIALDGYPRPVLAGFLQSAQLWRPSGSGSAVVPPRACAGQCAPRCAGCSRSPQDWRRSGSSPGASESTASPPKRFPRPSSTAPTSSRR